MLSVGSQRQSGNEFQTIGAVTENDRGYNGAAKQKLEALSECKADHAVHIKLCSPELHFQQDIVYFIWT